MTFFLGLAINDKVWFFHFTHKKVTPAGVVTTFAGNGSPGSQDGTGTNAQFSSPGGIAIDTNDNLFISDSQNHRIRKITPQGVVTTYAGSSQGYQN